MKESCFVDLALILLLLMVLERTSGENCFHYRKIPTVHLGSNMLMAFLSCICVVVCVFSCTVLLVNISQVIGREDCLQNHLDSVGWGIKLYSSSNSCGKFIGRHHPHDILVHSDFVLIVCVASL